MRRCARHAPKEPKNAPMRVDSNGFDIVGDLHGAVPQLLELLNKLGYAADLTPPQGRKLVFVGDLADRGSDNVGALRLVSAAVRAGHALLVLGNHDERLLRWLRGETIEIKGGIDRTIAEIEAQKDAASLKAELTRLLEMAPLVLELSGGKLVVAHAGVEEPILTKGIDEAAAYFILNGDAIGKSPDGKTLRRDWAVNYMGDAFVAYGHTPQPSVLIRNNTVNVDTGVYRTGVLSALRWPQMEIISVHG